MLPSFFLAVLFLSSCWRVQAVICEDYISECLGGSKCPDGYTCSARFCYPDCCDQISNCAGWKKNGFCDDSNYSSDIKALCQQTCGLCTPQTHDPSVRTPDPITVPAPTDVNVPGCATCQQNLEEGPSSDGFVTGKLNITYGKDDNHCLVPTFICVGPRSDRATFISLTSDKVDFIMGNCGTAVAGPDQHSVQCQDGIWVDKRPTTVNPNNPQIICEQVPSTGEVCQQQ